MISICPFNWSCFLTVVILHRLWDHLGSNLGLYVHPQELHPKGVPKTEPAPGDQAGKTGSHQIESETDKGNSIKTSRHHHNREYKGVGDEEAPLPRKSLANNENSRDENQPRDSHARSIRSSQSTIHKKRRRSDEVQQPRQVIFSCLVQILGGRIPIILCTLSSVKFLCLSI